MLFIALHYNINKLCAYYKNPNPPSTPIPPTARTSGLPPPASRAVPPNRANARPPPKNPGRPNLGPPKPGYPYPGSESNYSTII